MKRTENQYEDEYKNIRAEIVSCINLQNSLSTFMITAVTAILALALSNSNPWLYLLPYVIILPIGCGIFHYRANVLKLASYLIVFLEPNMQGMNWETRHAQYTKSKDLDKLFVFRNYLSVFLSVVVYLLFLFSYIPLINSMTAPALLAAFFPLLPTGYMMFLTWQTSRTLSSREKSIAQWQQVLATESQQPPVGTQSHDAQSS